MRRNFTVYGLRFSKTSFWNRLNTGFPDPAVATVLTACGIETNECMLHRPLQNLVQVATVLTACGIETAQAKVNMAAASFNRLQQYLPLAVLKRSSNSSSYYDWYGCNSTYRLRY